ncbi:uncharacterized protein LOC128182755 [Crassostrea angulata]|uniref:uncharacterized protein LOC128182755 n=1 Tax=Magallana angulata TaxID=2784310 RepID=UPI0022B13B49|nr:uncharacterized protein LOC128182755 [Crassostrea angulata]XP_052707457.1 uncharacterized protein LOC128182755 [Crassostrea angulata]
MGDKFVGRCKLMNDLKENWKQNRILGISGSMSVGKTRYVKEFLRDLKKSDENDKYKIVAIDFRSVETFEEYFKTIASCQGISIQDAKAIVQCVKSSEYVYIFHHDHQELAKLKSSSGGELTKTSQDSLWDKIYESIVKKLLEDTNNFFLIISSTDEFRFVGFRNLTWSQKLPELTEDESLELLDGVWSSAEKDKESCRHIVRLCNGVPSAIINTGLLLDEGAFDVQEAICLLLKHIIQFLSDESLPNSETLRRQLLCRWNNLNSAQMDHLVKSLVIIKNTCRITVKALAGLHQEYDSVAEFKLLNLLPLLRRNLLSVNKDDNSVIACPLIQHMLAAVDYIDTDALRKEIKAQILALLEPNAEDGDNCCKSLPKESTYVNELSEDNAQSADVQRPPGITIHCRQSLWNEDNNELTKNLRETPMESNQLEATHPEQSLNLSTDENKFQDLKNPSGFQESRQNSFIRDNLDREFSKKGCVYEDKDMHCSGDFSNSKQDSATDRKQSNLDHSTDHSLDSVANSDKPDMSEYKIGPEISLSGELSSSNRIFLRSPGYQTNNSEPNAGSSSLNQSLPSLTQGDQLVTVSGLKSIETNGSRCNQDGADANSEGRKHMSQSFQTSPKNKLGEALSRTRVEPETNIPGPSLQLDVTLSGESNNSFQNLHPAQTSQEGQNVQSIDVHAQNQSNTGSPTTLSLEAEAEGQNRSNSCSNIRFLIDDRSYSCDDSNRPQVQKCPTLEQGTLMEEKARGFPNQNANGSQTQHMSCDVSESTSGVSIENESRDSERTSSEESETNETTSSVSSLSIRGLMQGIVELYKSTE